MAQDIFEYAQGIVDNKSVAARIGHSGKLHSLRSAVSGKGSAASKFGALLGVAARATLNAIPIPAVGSLLSAVEKAVQDKVRGGMHQRRLAAARVAGDRATVVKFELKELTLEDLDRFRWKVSHSMTELNAAITAYPARRTAKAGEAAICDAYLELALAAEQATRRIRKLKEKCLGLNQVVKLTCDWIEECEVGAPPVPPGGAADPPGPAAAAAGGLLGAKNKIRELILEGIAIEDAEIAKAGRTGRDAAALAEWQTAYLSEFHANCNKWCCYRDRGTVDDYKTWKNNAAAVTRFLSDPFCPDDFNNNLGSLWKAN